MWVNIARNTVQYCRLLDREHEYVCGPHPVIEIPDDFMTKEETSATNAGGNSLPIETKKEASANAGGNSSLDIKKEVTPVPNAGGNSLPKDRERETSAKNDGGDSWIEVDYPLEWVNLPFHGRRYAREQSHAASGILRHKPDLRAEDGGVNVTVFCRIMRTRFAKLDDTVKVVMSLADGCEGRPRFQVLVQDPKLRRWKDDEEMYANVLAIRAIQGHTGPKPMLNQSRIEVTPDEAKLLYHGTNLRVVSAIQAKGLIPGGTQEQGRGDVYFSILDPRAWRSFPKEEKVRNFKKEVVVLKPYQYKADATIVVDMVAAYAAGLRFFQTPSAAVLCGSAIPPEFIVLITENRTGAILYSRKVTGEDKDDEPESSATNAGGNSSPNDAETPKEEYPGTAPKWQPKPKPSVKLTSNQEEKAKAQALKARGAWTYGPVQATQRARDAVTLTPGPNAGGDSMRNQPSAINAGGNSVRAAGLQEKQEPEADYGESEDEEIKLCERILAEETVKCSSCGKSNVKGLLTCSSCHYKLKVDHISDENVTNNINKITENGLRSLGLRWTMTWARGGNSDDAKKRKRARKMLGRLSKVDVIKDTDGKPYTSLVDRFIRDEWWATFRKREGHDEDSIRELQYLAESAPKTGYGLSKETRRKRYAGREKIQTDQHGGADTASVYKYKNFYEMASYKNEYTRKWNAQDHKRGYSSSSQDDAATLTPGQNAGGDSMRGRGGGKGKRDCYAYSHRWDSDKKKGDDKGGKPK